MTKEYKNWHISTQVAQALGSYDRATDGVVPAIHTATTYYRDADNQYRSGRIYSRDQNPSYLPAEELLAELEQGEQALLFSSGMAAAVAVFLSLPQGAHVIAPKIMYWALRKWLLEDAPRFGLSVTLVDMTDVAAVKDAIQEGKTALIWIESPANPLWLVTDIKAVVQAANAFDITVAVDSTIATPIHCRPLMLGADIVMHSATKYLNGHSDVIAGALVTRQTTLLWQTIAKHRKQAGAVLSPFDASQLLRGMRTLVIRVQKASQNALKLAQLLQERPEITEVLYPGLPTSQGHAVATSQWQQGYTGMLSIRLAAGEQVAIQVAAHTRIWRRATSLGSVESLIEHRASIEGEGTPVPKDLLRLSVGIEEVNDLYDDLCAAIRLAHHAV